MKIYAVVFRDVKKSPKFLGSIRNESLFKLYKKCSSEVSSLQMYHNRKISRNRLVQNNFFVSTSYTPAFF